MNTREIQQVYIVSKNTSWTKLIIASLSTAFKCYSFIALDSIDTLSDLKQSAIVILDKSSVASTSLLSISPIERGGKWLIANAEDLDEENVAGIISLGFVGLITSPLTCEMLPRALRSITKNQLWFSRDAMSKTLINLISPAKNKQNSANIIAAKFSLSNRERQVLSYLLHGKSNKEIAAQLYLSPSTIKCHVSNILYKTGTHSRCEIGMYLVQEDNKTLETLTLNENKQTSY